MGWVLIFAFAVTVTDVRTITIEVPSKVECVKHHAYIAKKMKEHIETGRVQLLDCMRKKDVPQKVRI